MDKSRIITIMLLLSLGLCVETRAQEEGSGLVRFPAPELSVDTVRFDGGAHTLRYPFRNISSQPVTVLEVHSSCGCFTGEVNTRTLKPGASAVLTAVFDPKSLHGAQNRHLTVVTSDGTDTFLSSVSVKAYVLRDLSEGEIRFAEDLGQGLRTDSVVNRLTKDEFGDFVFSIPLYNDTDKTVSLEISAPRRVKLYAPEAIAPYSRVQLRGEYNALWKLRGSEVLETLTIKVDGAETTPLQIKGTIQ